MVAVLVEIVVNSSTDVSLTASSAVGGCVSCSDDVGCVGGEEVEVEEEERGVKVEEEVKRTWRRRCSRR